MASRAHRRRRVACGISGAASPVRVCHERLVNPPHDCQAFACPAWPRRHYNGRAMAEELNLDGSRLSFAVVVARFNEAITSRLLDGALGAIKRHGVGEHAVYWVPSSATRRTTTCILPPRPPPASSASPSIPACRVSSASLPATTKPRLLPAPAVTAGTKGSRRSSPPLGRLT